MFTIDTINLAWGLPVLVCFNIILGSINGILDGSYDKDKLRKGILKGAIVSFIMVGTYVVGYFNGNIVQFTVNDEVINLAQAVVAIMVGGFMFYGKEVISKLLTIIKTTYPTKAE